jgi:hypothetical protein
MLHVLSCVVLLDYLFFPTYVCSMFTINRIDYVQLHVLDDGVLALEGRLD